MNTSSDSDKLKFVIALNISSSVKTVNSMEIKSFKRSSGFIGKVRAPKSVRCVQLQ